MKISKLFEKGEETEFITFPLTLKTYAWYKPILILIIAAIICFGLSFAILKLAGADPRENNIISIIYTAITVILMIPAIYIGTKLVYKIPFSTQIAPVRKWNWGIYIKVFIISLIVYALFGIYQILSFGISISIDLPIAIFLLCIILPLFQGFAEEYLCRGILMQTFGSWFKIPIVAIILQAAIFAVLHHYQISVLIAVLCIGILYGLTTWYGQGLEASSAMHSVNNIYTFLVLGLGLQNGVGNSNAYAIIINIVIVSIPIIIILVLEKKFNLIGFKN